MSGGHFIPLSKRGKETLQARVSEEDYEYLNGWKWSWHNVQAAKRGSPKPRIYAMRWENDDGRTINIYMHRVVLRRKRRNELGEGRVIDHINGRPLDNRRGNLRLSSRSHNRVNSTSAKASRGNLQIPLRVE